MAFTPDGKAVLGIDNGRLQRWDAATGKPVFPAVDGHMRGANLAFAPDGTRLASLAWNGVRLWDVPARKPEPRLSFRPVRPRATEPTRRLQTPGRQARPGEAGAPKAIGFA